MIIKPRDWGQILGEYAGSETREIIHLWNILVKPVGNE